MPVPISRSLEILRDEGPVVLARSGREYALATLEDQWLKYRYWLKYGGIAPRPEERLCIDSRCIDYTHSSEYLTPETVECVVSSGFPWSDREYPRYGILGGSWDRHKNYWRDSPVWSGLQERFEEDKPWCETTYYQHSVAKLNAGERVAYLDGPQTLENFENYLTQLDELYENVKRDGYDPSSVITVHVGRNGEWMAGHGNHRRTIASIVGVESIPVRIKFRHRKWQTVRQRFHEAGSLEEIRDIAEYRNHPDVPDVTDG